MRYLLDTNTCIRFLRQRHLRLVERVRSHSPSQVCVCSVVVAELFHGSERSEHPASNREKILAFLRPFVSFPFDDKAAVVHAAIRRRLEAAGTPIGPYDSQIAAIALVHGLTVVTHNTVEFARVPELKLEDWESD